MKSPGPGSVRSIGVFHLSQLGDLVFSLPALAALRAGFPAARISSVVRAGLAELLCPSPWVDACIPHRGSGDFLAALRRVRHAAFDLAICLSQSPRVMLLARASGARRRVGFAGGALSGFLTDRVAKTTIPSLENDLRLVEALGCAVEQRDYCGLLSVAGEDRRMAERLLAERGVSTGARLVVVGASASARRSEKEWPIERFLEVARAATAHAGVEVAFVGSEAQIPSAAVSRAIHDLGGRTSLRCLAGILERAELFVGIDSGVLHLAAALATPCVALYGPTDPAVTGPCGEDHVVIQADEATGGLSTLPSERVGSVVEGLLS